MKKYIIFILILINANTSFGQKSTDYYLSGMAKMKAGETDSAIYFLNMAILQEPDKYLYYLRRGEINYGAGRYEEAIHDFESIDPTRISISDFWLAKCYARLSNNEQAIKFLEKHLQSGSVLNQKEIKEDEAFDQLQLTDEWYQLWQNDRYSNEELLEDDIDYLITQENYLEALNLVDEKLANSNKPEILYQYRARIEEIQGNYRASALDWTEAINRNKNEYRLYKKRGIAYLKAKKYIESYEDFSKAIKMESADFELYILRSKASRGQNNFKSALKDLSTYLQFFPDDESILFYHGELQYENENYLDALRSFNRCLQLDNSNPIYYKVRGRTYLQTGLFKYAIDDFSMSLDLNATDGETYYFKGLARFYTGDKSGACDDWKESTQLGDKKAFEMLIKHCQ